MSQSTSPKTETMSDTASTAAAQQGDNIAHALAGAGGGLLSMTLTYIPPSFSLNQSILPMLQYDTDP